MAEAVAFAKSKDIGLFVLGGGSNILVSDAGFDGLVLQIGLKGVVSEPAGGFIGPMDGLAVHYDQPPAIAGGYDYREKYLVTTRAGEDWDAFVAFCVDEDLAGVECLSGIPGFVGGTPVQNVGAYGQEVSETIVCVRCLDRARGEIVELANADCGFNYRTSIFNTAEAGRYVVLSVTFSLEKSGAAKIVYKDLKEFFAGREPTLRETREAVLRIRAAKSMVIDANDPNSRAAGLFFKNPIVERAMLDEISKAAGVDNLPRFDVDAERVKVPAAWLIENAGFYKGFAMGNAGISTKHSLAIVNRGGATAADILALKDAIVTRVYSKFGIELRPEPIFVGF